MSNRSLRSLLPLAAAALFSLTAGQAALAADGAAAYRATVLGQSVATPAGTPTQSSTGLVPGSYAQYLMYLGRSVDQAIAEARDAGEQPGVSPVARETVRPLDGQQAYLRLLGRS